MATTTTIRIPSETRTRLNALARRRGASAGEVVAKLVSEADELAMLVDAEEDWRALSADPQALAAYRSEASELQGFDRPLPEY